MRILRLLMICLFLSAAGCSGLVSPTGGTVEAGTAASPAGTAAAATQSPAPATPFSPESATPAGPVTLRVWVPPSFDPKAGPAGALLQARLDEFSQRRAPLRVEVRVKALDGQGGLLDSLTTASAAAPLALPDLIALPHTLLDTAALKGLVHPFDGFTSAFDDSDWYEYARILAHLQSSTFGLPFAGDALVLAYRPGVIAIPPADLASALAAGQPLIFSAADPQALYTLALYQSAGGPVRDDQGRPFLDAEILARVLSIYAEAQKTETIPYWITQFSNDDLVWDAFLEQRAHLAITWSSHYLGGMVADTAAASIPTLDGAPFTLASGWVWALASPQPDRQKLAAELAEFLTDSSFLAEWTEAAGYLPPRPSALEGWKNSSLQPLVGEVVNAAHLYPSADVLTSLGSALESATTQVLKGESDPTAAAQAAAASLQGP